MDTVYWVKEYIMVMLAYGFVMFVWPEIIFRKFLKGRSLTVHICFDTMFMILASNLYVLTLGLCHILNPWTVRIGFWGGILASIIIPFVRKYGDRTLDRFRALLIGSYGIKSFGRNAAFRTKNLVRAGRRKINSRIINHALLYAMLILAIIYGMIYTSIGVFQNRSFGFSDLYVHQQWIYELGRGHIFIKGIYPEGMHTFICLINACFGIPVYSLMLFMQPVHIALFYLSAFLLAKEIFNWRYTAVLGLIIFLTVGYSTPGTILAFSRLQCSLPMEFGASAALICPTFLLRYLKDAGKKGTIIDIKKLYKDENLLIFGLALFVTISTHFYCTIVAFFLCLAVVPVYLREVFSPKHFTRLLITVVVSVFLAVLPMLVALAEGMQFQGSIGWAIGVIQGNNGGESGTVVQPGTSTGSGEIVIIVPDDEPEEPIVKVGPFEAVTSAIRSFYAPIFSSSMTTFYLFAVMVAVFATIVLAVIRGILKRRWKKAGKAIGSGPVIGPLVALLLMLVNIMIMTYPKALGLPRLIDGNRLNYYATLINVLVLLIPADIVFGSLNLLLKDSGDGIIAVAAAVGSMILVVNTGNYHGSLYFELTSYASAADTVARIIRENPKDTYSIVSTGTETWQVAVDGYHEELITFLNGTISKSYKLPTERVYIFIEKHPLRYIQFHFPETSAWLADSRQSQNIMSFTGLVTTGKDNVVNYDLDMEQAKKERVKFTSLTARSLSQLYQNKNSRILIQSRAMNWIHDFEESYPRTLKVYYEDEDFVCYYFEQNPNATYELAIQEMNREEQPIIGAPVVDPDDLPQNQDQIDYVVEYIYNPDTGDIITRIINYQTGEIILEKTN